MSTQLFLTPDLRELLLALLDIRQDGVLAYELATELRQALDGPAPKDGLKVPKEEVIAYDLVRKVGLACTSLEGRRTLLKAGLGAFFSQAIPER